MARYINTDEALQIIDSYAKTVTEEGKVVVDAVRDIVAIITPTTDVVPRAEIEKIFAEIEGLIDKHYNKHIFGNNDLEDEEKEAVMNFSDDVTYDIAELKKKYIGDKE